MNIEETNQKLIQMKMHTFARGFREMLETPTSKQLSFEDRVGLLVDQEWTERENRRVERRIKEAHLSCRAGPEEILCDSARGLDKPRWLEFTTSRWVRAHQNIIVVGPTGVGKSFVGNALAQAACRQGFRALLVRVPRLFEQLAIARASAAYTSTLARMAKIDVLVLDDFLLAPKTAWTTPLDDLARSRTVARNHGPAERPRLGRRARHKLNATSSPDRPRLTSVKRRQRSWRFAMVKTGDCHLAHSSVRREAAESVAGMIIDSHAFMVAGSARLLPTTRS